MDEETQAQTTENETPSESQTENQQEVETQSDEGENTRNEKDVPFHEHPRWKEREESWQKRFNEMEQRHQEMLAKLLQNKTEEQPKKVEIPVWFVGGEEEWNDYKQSQEAIEARAVERAYKKIQEEREKEMQAKAQEEKMIKEANEYFQKNVEELKKDPQLNPTGEDLDANKLLKYTMDNYFLDEKGRWDYKKAYKYMKLEEGSVKNNANRKTVAGATTSDNKGENKDREYRTSEDFKKYRPW